MTFAFSSDGRRAVCAAAITLVMGGTLLSGCGGEEQSAALPTHSPSSSTGPTKKNEGLNFGGAMDASRPVSVSIPAIDVRSKVMKLGLDSKGHIEIPPLSKPKLTGWYKKGPTPGEMGPAVILGHIDNQQGPAVFYDLRTLKPGAKVKVKRKDGTVAVFKVDSVKRFPKSDFPTQKVYGELDYPGIRLITCGGAFDESAGHYKDNIIAFGRLVSTHQAKSAT